MQKMQIATDDLEGLLLLFRFSQDEVDPQDVYYFSRLLQSSGIDTLKVSNSHAPWTLTLCSRKGELIGADRDFDGALDKLCAELERYRNRHCRDVMVSWAQMYYML